MKAAKTLLKKAFNTFGLSISRLPTLPPHPSVYLKTDLLFDVGANIGQYAMRVRELGYKNKIVSFEPLSAAHKLLCENASNDAKWVIHERCAVGSKAGETEINISQNSYSSSVLPMLAAHSNAAPESIYVGKETAKVVTVDSVFNDYRRENERVFLKIDTQGYEKHVLDGAMESLRCITGVQLELSIVPLYETQNLYDYFFQHLSDRGFTLWSLIPGFSNPRSGQLLQFDAIFVKQIDPA